MELTAAVDAALPLRVEAELYRIAQEALANVRRHAHTRVVTVDLRANARGVRLTIRDNGRGFEPRAVAADRHGVVGMRERARLLGGRLRVETRPGAGTTLRVTVPPAEAAP